MREMPTRELPAADRENLLSEHRGCAAGAHSMANCFVSGASPTSGETVRPKACFANALRAHAAWQEAQGAPALRATDGTPDPGAFAAFLGNCAVRSVPRLILVFVCVTNHDVRAQGVLLGSMASDSRSVVQIHRWSATSATWELTRTSRMRTIVNDARMAVTSHCQDGTPAYQPRCRLPFQPDIRLNIQRPRPRGRRLRLQRTWAR
jgi:hypothetical protein